MTLRALTIILLGLIITSCNTTDKQNKTAHQEIKKNTEPDYNIAIRFINDYLDYLNDMKSKIGLIEWIENRTDVSAEFKIELKRVLDEAEKNDPEIGLGFDPVLDAQDNPNEFELDRYDSIFLTAKGKDWSDFRLTLKVKFLDNKWIVDGAGIINIPEKMRAKR